MLFNANVKENVKEIVTRKTIEMFSAFILITNLGHKRILATISICAHLRWQSIISDSYLTISLRIKTWLHRGIVLNAQSLVQCLVPRPSPWAQDQPPRNEVTAHFGRLVTALNSDSLKIPLYDKVLDAVEMKAQFASKILTPCRMH